MIQMAPPKECGGAFLSCGASRFAFPFIKMAGGLILLREPPLLSCG